MKYLLDTNFCIYLIKKKPTSVLKKLQKCRISNIGISSITLSELEYGVEKSTLFEKNKIALLEFLAVIDIYPFDEVAARRYGTIRAHLEKQGKVMGPFDMLIAAHAKALDVILVTNNMKEFKRVPDLKIENWVRC